MSNFTISILIVIVFAVIILYMNQQKLKNKMLCTFIRPNRQKIEQWVPLDTKYVIFDGGKYATGAAFSGHNKGRYHVDPHCITMMWYNRGVNRFFPVLIPTLEFKWDTPNPLDPTTFQSTWKTPEAIQMGWEEHQHRSFAKATLEAQGKRGRFPEWLFPLATIGLILIVLYIVWQGMSGLDLRMFNLEQQVKLLMP